MFASRRRFLQIGSASMASALAKYSWADELPRVTAPRATDGDERHEPDWDERLTITVGPKKADLVGRDDKVLQAAVDYVAGKGGGTVKVLPGDLHTSLRRRVALRSPFARQRRRIGHHADSFAETVALSADSDWYDREITLSEAGDFRVGDSVVLQAKNPDNNSSTVIKRTIVARSGNRFKLDDGLRKNVWLSGNPSCSSLFPLLTSEYTADVTIEDITLDGNRENTKNFNGNYGGCIFLQDCNRYTMPSRRDSQLQRRRNQFSDLSRCCRRRLS